MMLERVIAKLKNKRILVLGAGLTGMSCVNFLTKHQLSCTVNDSRADIIDPKVFDQQYPDHTLVLGKWQQQAIETADVIIASPGIDLCAEGISSLIKPETVLMGDVELFCQLTDKPILAVTGSNGKSTVVSLLAHIGEALGYNIGLGGNIGTPVLDQLTDDIDYYVLELSSFQLETVTTMKALAATVLNVSDDHLDRHKTLASYSAIKQKIYQLANVAVINRDDSLSHTSITSEQQHVDSKVVSFGHDKPDSGDFGLMTVSGNIYLAYGETPLIALDSLPLAGIHNAMNYLAVLALGVSAGWSLENMVQALDSFTGLPHRCQRVDTRDDIIWINDSKATNVGATIAAINGLAPTLKASNKLILLAGGDGKGADFSPLQPVFSQHVAQVFAIGKDGDKIAALSEHSMQLANLPLAVTQASSIANAGDIVLLSPACASIDMFKNFAERGQVFVDAVQALQEAC
ncbi:UDP-N-acetylmuramoyl-L-alanine--D-glutamate ligase [Thalassotalea sp. G2M2-11]|uniref:UDP-N-acetylmuramoyl-L-alanine--D-glutamate ligase n=1 Tax=Thalassotalea sp. G2M2-11 TaxID=2787627 RepID=UPI001F49FB00|nr:UDP-N-acetylmuramoyl-L-alanine--D-glutamate ligase [Thalassotalea sp. G2M2-11]